MPVSILPAAALDGYLSNRARKYELLFGRVASIEDTGNAFLVELADCITPQSGASVQVTFRNFGNYGREMLYERFIAGNIRIGCHISVLCSLWEEQTEYGIQATRTALDYRYAGMWRFKGALGEKHVFFGTPNTTNLGKGFLRFSEGTRTRHFDRLVYFPKIDASRFLAQDRTYMVCICGEEKQYQGMQTYVCTQCTTL